MITSVTNQTNNTYTNTSSVSSTASTSFANVLANISLSQNSWLDTAREEGYKDPNRPNPYQLVEATGLSMDEVEFKLYTVANGSYTDTRDWAKIMSAADPKAALNEATQQFLESLPATELQGFIAQEDNFVLLGNTNSNGNTVLRIGLVTDNGHLIRKMGSSTDLYFDNLEHIKSVAKEFGYETEGLDALVHDNDAQPQASTPVAQENTTMSAPTPEISTVTTPTDPNLAALTNLYQNYLNREPDAEGLAFWSQKLNEGATLQEIEKAFYISSEFILKSSNTASITATPSTTASTASSKNATLEELLSLL